MNLMAEPEKLQSIPEDLLIDNPTIFLKKVANFASAGPTGIHAVFDFDRTLTVKKPGSHDEVTNQRIQAKSKKTFSRFDAIIETGSLLPLRNLLRMII